MMYISPSSLQDVCVNYICDNLFALCDSVPVNKYNHIDSLKVSPIEEVKLQFVDNEVYFHSEISEQLLRTLCIKGKLTDYTLTLFDNETTRLR